MRSLTSIRTKLQLVVVALALAAIGVTGVVVTIGADNALRQATYERLTAIRETRRLAVERYFDDLSRHVVALSTSESTASALQDLREAWPHIQPVGEDDESMRALEAVYARTLSQGGGQGADATPVSTWLPSDPRVRALQAEAIAANPHPDSARDLLLEVGGRAADWGRAHAQHHPTFHRYQSAFGFYDIFLISAPEGRVLYSVMKEVDLGADLTAAPYRNTGLGQVYAAVAASDAPDAEPAVALADYTPYVASGFAPAAFIAAPVKVAGATVGVLAMQISIREIDRVMTQGRNWREAGFGDTGQAYIVGSDNTLRSDLRPLAEDPEAFYTGLTASGVSHAVVDRIRADRTTVLNLPVDLGVRERLSRAPQGTEIGVDLQGRAVLRSHAALQIPGLQWTLVAELARDEALAPVRTLQAGVITAGVVLAALFFLVAGWIGASVTRPVLELATAVGALGGGARGAQVPVRSTDEIGDLGRAFNRMSEELERTTVSKVELEVLAQRLITAQEDERRRIGRELHDDLVQRLAATAIDVGTLERNPALTPDLRGGLVRVKQTLAALSEDVHGLSRRVHPALLDDLGLPAAIEAECRAFVERGGAPVEIRIDPALGGLDADLTLAVYRIVQETLRNIWQHASATEVSLTLEPHPRGVRLCVDDDGHGFERPRPGERRGLGLASMEERAHLLGGTFSITSTPGRGTRVEVVIPRAPHHAQAENSAR